MISLVPEKRKPEIGPEVKGRGGCCGWGYYKTVKGRGK